MLAAPEEQPKAEGGHEDAPEAPKRPDDGPIEGKDLPVVEPGIQDTDSEEVRLPTTDLGSIEDVINAAYDAKVAEGGGSI